MNVTTQWKFESRCIVATFDYSFAMRKDVEQAPKLCRDMERNIATELWMEGRMNVATFDNFFATKNTANG